MAFRSFFVYIQVCVLISSLYTVPLCIDSSGESRKFFLPVLCMPEAHNSGGSKIIFLWLRIKKGKWVLDIH